MKFENMKAVAAVFLCLLVVSIACLPAFAITDEDRRFFKEVAGEDGSDEQVLLLAAVADEVEKNYSVLYRYRELQTIYTKNRPKSLAREAYVYGKLAYNEFLHGSKEKASTYCNVALGDIKSMPEPIELGNGYYFVSGTSALVNTLAGLKRIADYNRTSTLLGHARIRFGRLNTEILMFRAVHEIIDGDLKSARALCNDAIKAEPGYAGSYYLKAILDLKDSQVGTALRNLDRSIALCPDFSHAYMLKGACLFMDDKKKEALEATNKAVELSKCSDNYRLRAAIKLVMEDQEGGAADLDESIKAADANWDSFMMHGDVMFNSRRYDEALSDYTHAINMMSAKIKKLRAKAHYRRGLCYRNLGNDQKAKTDFDTAIALEPSRAAQVNKLLAKIPDEDSSTAGSDKDKSKDKGKDAKPEDKTTLASASSDDDSDSDEGGSKNYASYIASADPSMPTFKEGENYFVGSKGGQAGAKEYGRAKTLAHKKLNWISEDKSDASARAIFPFVSIWLPNNQEAILLASQQPFKIDVPRIEARMNADAQLKQSLHAVGYDSAAALLSTYVVSGAALDEFTKDSPSLTDNYPRLEFFLPYAGSKISDLEIESIGDEDLKSLVNALDHGRGFDKGEFWKNWESIHLLREIGKHGTTREKADQLINDASALMPDNCWLQYVSSHRSSFAPSAPALEQGVH